MDIHAQPAQNIASFDLNANAHIPWAPVAAPRGFDPFQALHGLAQFGFDNWQLLAAASVATLVLAPGKLKLLALLPVIPAVPIVLIAAAMDT